MSFRRKVAPEEEFLPINHVRAVLLRIWGPADSWDNPLVGTKYDPARAAARQHASTERHRATNRQRRQHWEQFLQAHHHGHP